MIKIDKGVKIPNLTRGDGMKYPWGDMESGDSVAFKTQKEYFAARKSATLYVKAHRPGWKVVGRTANEGTFKFRLWLVDKNEPEKVTPDE